MVETSYQCPSCGTSDPQNHGELCEHKAAERIRDDLAAQGIEARVITGDQYAGGMCERCGNEVPELAFGGCFPCGMLEDPESDEHELYSGVAALFEYGTTYHDWIAARERWGKLVPDEAQRERIKAQVRKHAEVRIFPWLTAHRDILN